MPLAVTLDDKYLLESGRVYLTGTQALVRLPMMQRQRDLAAGLNTACYISGYRGSPLGGFDQALWQAKRFIKKNHIEFQPGVNEDLAATALWGTQQIHLYPGARYDGVFGMWYGKGPGVDRSGDVLKHANYAGTSRHGGIVALAGDDHMAKSSTTAHQSEPALIAAGIPVIHPASVQEYLDFGLHAFAMSRYSGLWVAFKVLSETVDSSASVHVDPHRVEIHTPTDFILPTDGVHIRWPDDWLGQERRVVTIKQPAALAYWRANKLDRLMMGRPDARFGIVTVGKSYLDVRQALDDLGIDDQEAERLGLAIYKVALVWPLETEGASSFAQGKREILVVEEKRSLIEQQLKDALFNAPADRRPVVVGKTDERGQKLLKSDGELTPFEIASAIVARFGLDCFSAHTRQRFEMLKRKSARQVRNEFGHGARALFLLRLPAQHLDQGAGRLDGDGRHRLPYAGHRHGAQHQDLHPHGRRGRDLGRRLPLHRHAARLPEPGRRHLFPLGLPRDPPRDRHQHQHHLQDPLQRRRRHDRRPAARRRRPSLDDQPAGPCRGRAPHRPGERRSAQVPGRHRMGARRHLPSPRRAGRGPARAARRQGRVGPDLRPDLRRREAPPAQARHLPRPRQARVHQPGGVRGLRRLLGQVELPLRRAGRDRVRQQARHRPVVLQQGLLLPERLLPELRHRRRRQRP